MIKAKLILHSKVKTGEEITSWILTFHRYVLAEFNTHRVFSRNAASSRAIPTLKQLRRVLTNMAVPVEWGANNPGMQSKSLLEGWKKLVARIIWRTAGYTAVLLAYLMYLVGVHKQIVNRIIEPWTWTTVLMTTTDLQNFFELRAHKDAQPEIRVLAELMKLEYETSFPKNLLEGDWHVPFSERFRIHGEFNSGLTWLDDELYSSIARAARVSYMNHDGSRSTMNEDVKLANKLIKMRPLHASPAEHQVQYNPKNPNPGNLYGPFVQLRKILEKEVYKLDSR